MATHTSDTEQDLKVSAIRQNLPDDADFSSIAVSMVQEIGRTVRYVERLTEYKLCHACLSVTANQKCVGRGTLITASCSTTLKTSYEIGLDDISPMILEKLV